MGHDIQYNSSSSFLKYIIIRKKIDEQKNREYHNINTFICYTWLADLAASPHVTTEANCCLS
jgi:hypothetical protein